MACVWHSCSWVPCGCHSDLIQWLGCYKQPTPNFNALQAVVLVVLISTWYYYLCVHCKQLGFSGKFVFIYAADEMLSMQKLAMIINWIQLSYNAINNLLFDHLISPLKHALRAFLQIFQSNIYFKNYHSNELFQNIPKMKP